MERNSLTPSHTSNIWRSLLFDPSFGLISYAQKVNAAFHYILSFSTTSSTDVTTNNINVASLESKIDEESFKLHDFMQHGNEVMMILNLQDYGDMSALQDNMFTAMDHFRQLDRRHRGAVNIDEFVVGIIERLRILAADKNLLMAVAEEVLNATIEDRNNLLDESFSSLSMEPDNTDTINTTSTASNNATAIINNTFPTYCRVMSSYHYLLITRIEATNTRDILIPIVSDSGGEKDIAAMMTQRCAIVMHLFQCVLADVEDELLRYFHVSVKKLHALLGDATADVATSVDVSSRLNAGDAMNELIQRSVDRRTRSDKGPDHPYRSRILWKPDISIPSDDDHLTSSISHSIEKDHMKILSDIKDHHSLKSSLSSKSHHLKDKDGVHMHVPSMDETQVFLLKTAHTALKNFFAMHGIHDIEQQEEALQRLSSAARAAMTMDVAVDDDAIKASSSDVKAMVITEHFNLPLTDEDQDRWLLRALFKCQEQCRRLQVRLDLVEMIHSNEAKIFGSSAAVDTNISSDANISIDMETSTISATYDDILNEMNDLKSVLIDKGRMGIAAKSCTTQDAASSSASSLSIVSAVDEVKKLALQLASHAAMAPHKSLSSRKLMDPIDSMDDQFRGLVSFREQVKEERNEHLKTAVELQIMKEKVVRLQKEIASYKVNGSNNMMNSPRRSSSQDLMHSPQPSPQPDTNKRLNGNMSPAGDVHPISSSSTSASSHHHILPEDMNDLRVRLHDHQSQLEEVTVERDRLVRENRRMGNAVKNAEDRVRAVLQDQMLLSSQLQTAEDELEGSRTVMQQLMDRLEQERGMRESEEVKADIINELRRDLSRRDSDIMTLKEEANHAKRFKQEIVTLEAHIDGLETRLSEQTREVEKGSAAIEQMDRYRIQLSEVTKQNREVSLNAASLESQLKAMQQLQVKYKDACQELNDYKLKVEKIPSLMAEIARLRGSSRASMKALMEQDKQIAELRNTMKTFERENLRLKSDNRSMLDVEIRLRDANAEIQRLTAVAGEVSALKTDARNAEEERKNMEVNYRKMRKFLAQGPGGIRASIINPNPIANIILPTSSATSSSGARIRPRTSGHAMMTAEDYGDMEAELHVHAANHHNLMDNDDDNDNDDGDHDYIMSENNQYMNDEDEDMKISDDDQQSINPFITELRSKLKPPN